MVGPLRLLLGTSYHNISCYFAIYPTGQLPYLTHGLHSVSGFLAIQKFVEKLEGSHDLDTSLHGVEHAKSIAQISHAESELGDLVVSSIGQGTARHNANSHTILGSLPFLTQAKLVWPYPQAARLRIPPPTTLLCSRTYTGIV